MKVREQAFLASTINMMWKYILSIENVIFSKYPYSTCRYADYQSQIHLILHGKCLWRHLNTGGQYGSGDLFVADLEMLLLVRFAFTDSLGSLFPVKNKGERMWILKQVSVLKLWNTYVNLPSLEKCYKFNEVYLYNNQYWDIVQKHQ